MMRVIQPHINLELDEGEQVLYTTRRHWIVLLQRSLAPLLAGGLALGLASYRAVGGRFIVSGIEREGLDWANLLILALIVLIWELRRRARKRNPKKPTRGILHLAAIGVLGLTFFFRFDGGRIFDIEETYARGIDTPNMFLLLFGLLMMLAIVYTAIDWANDYLILTNFRVIYDDTQFLVRHVQQQMLINDIQQINMRQETYPAYWLDFGTLVLRSFSPRRLMFEKAANPKQMQERIFGEVSKLRRAQEPEMLRTLIEDQVYGNKPPKAPGPAIHVEERKGPIGWLFHVNPEIKYETDTIVWRPFWLFLLFALMRPIGTLTLWTIALILVSRLELIANGWLIVLWIPALLACGFWAYWVYLEHEHDLYILTRQNITDVDKKPFGPESRRVAPLGAIQDISFHVGFFEAALETLFGLGYGDVTIETGGAGGGKFTFKHVPDPRGVQATINDYLTDFRKHEKEQQMQGALSLLKQYHILQSEHGELMDNERMLAAVTERLSGQIAAEMPSRVAHEVSTQLQGQVQRNVHGIVRRELMSLLRRRKRSP